MRRLVIAGIAVLAFCAWIVHELDATESTQPVVRAWTASTPMTVTPSTRERLTPPATFHDPPRTAPPSQPGLQRSMRLQPGGTHEAPRPGE